MDDESRRDWLAHPETRRELERMIEGKRKALAALVAKALESSDGQVAALAAVYQERQALCQRMGGK